jgi:ketosteroid isomerase-like protein
VLVEGAVSSPGWSENFALNWTWTPPFRARTIAARMSESDSVAIVMEAFRAVEQRDEERLLELYHPAVEFHPDRRRPSWSDVWDPLQPTEAQRRMDPRVVAATEQEVVVLWRQRGVRADGERFEGEVLGLYEVRDGKFARAQMFYFDTVAAQRFLGSPEGRTSPQAEQGAVAH